jgi:ABC-type transport system involved in cytochrome bd biosynthesis fused ATPase/permease subunit
MTIRRLPLIVLGIGVLLVAISLVWPRIIARTVWNQQQASQHAEAAAELHRLSHARAHAADHAAEGKEEHKGGSLEEARQRYDRSQTALQQARAYRRGSTWLLRGAGGACALLGAAGYFLLRAAAR